MNLLILFVFVLSVMIGVAHGVDLVLWTDLSTGFCTAGSVWWRYGSLAVGVLIAVLAGWLCAGKPEKLQRRSPAAGILSALAGVFMAAAALAQVVSGLSSLGGIVRAVLELLSANWFAALAASWLKKDGWQMLRGGLITAVLGSVVFYWNVLARFMENSSSWHRVGPTTEVWQYLAALLFLSALARALYIPQPQNRKALCASGLAALFLCLCWELPQLAAQALFGAVLLPELLAGLALCMVGALGGVCAVACSARADG